VVWQTSDSTDKQGTRRVGYVKLTNIDCLTVCPADGTGGEQRGVNLAFCIATDKFGVLNFYLHVNTYVCVGV